MKEITVEGFKVNVESGREGGFVLTIPALPGIVGQVAKEEEVAGEARRLIGAHLRQIASSRPHMHRKAGGKPEDDPAGKTKR
jgi:predicted RNase H-like HicB family nuclease